jgi:hypothetical protein
VRGRAPERAWLKTLALARFSGTADPSLSSLYIGAAFQIDGKAAADALFDRLNEMSPPRQAVLVQCVLPHVFGDRMFWDGPPLENMTLQSLERLVRLSFEVIRIEDDNVHRSGHAYSPDVRDHPEHARSAAFNRLACTPGRATFNAIMRLATTPDFPIPAEHTHAEVDEVFGCKIRRTFFEFGPQNYFEHTIPSLCSVRSYPP